MGLLDGFLSLSAKVNKVDGTTTENQDGRISDYLPELKLDMTDEELISLKKEWERKWENDKSVGKFREQQKENEKYYVGEHFTESGDMRPLADNLIFQATETFLPIVTRQNPDPVVEADNTDEGNNLADRVQKVLKYQADRQRLKLKLQRVGRYWSVYLLGVAKVGWNKVKNDIDTVVVRPQKMILDPDAVIDGCVYQGEYLGEYRKDKASDLVLRFPKQKDFINSEVGSKMGTQLQYIEWWTDDYTFWTYKDKVLDKVKNPHWNYEQKQQVVDEFGNVTENLEQGRNHFPLPKKPYIFFTVFNLGLHPFDDTNIIQQNLALQDMINKRIKQIDKNADNTNNSIAVSGSFFTKDQAGQVANALRRGDPIWVPQGNASEAVARLDAPALPQFIYQSLIDYRTELMNVYGVRGMTPAGISSEDTVRGKIIVKGQDADRASLITETMEQFADEIFNWWVQLIYVYYDEPHFASVLGKERAKEYVQLVNVDLDRKLDVTVKEGSMIPKDSLTKANQAVELFQAGLLDPITAFERLEFPNPRETAEKLFLWKANPIAMFPDLQQQQQPPEMGGGMPPQAPQPQEELVPPAPPLNNVLIQ